MNSNSLSIKVFINWLDTYTGYNLSRHFTSPAAGVSRVTDVEPETETLDEVPSRTIIYDVCGTLKMPDTNKSMAHVHKIISRFNQMELIEWLNICDVIIFDITDDPEQIDEAKWALHLMEDNMRSDGGSKTFILLSTVLTWLRTPIKHDIRPSEEEEDMILPTEPVPFTEDDFRRRKPHPNYKKHWALEKDVIRIGRFKPEALKTYVISSGLKYGKGEDILFYYFKSAWLNAPFLPCIGNGRNTIPFIYIIDLALLLQGLIERNEVSPTYILAVDGNNTRLDSIVKIISEKLSTGGMRKISIENALLINELKSKHLDHLSCDLLMESTFIVNLTYTGIVPHISEVIEEFKEAHGLEPIRIFIHGPPGSSEKELAEEIATHYKLHTVYVRSTIQEKIVQLKKITTSESELLMEGELEGEEQEETENEIEAETSDEEESEDEGAISQNLLMAQEYLKMLKESQERNYGEIEDKYIIQILQEKLLSKPCQNQGFVFYGFPDTTEQAKELFVASSEIDDAVSFNTLIMPELVVHLDASDSFLKEKLILLPEIELIEQFGSEESLIRKLTEYRSINTDESSILDYFDEQEIRIEVIDISMIESNKAIIERIKRILGPPRNFGLSPEETEKRLKLKAEETLKFHIAAKLKAEEAEREENAERAELLREWQKKLSDVQIQEEQLLEAESLPMRNYLMQHVLPVLSQGLLECVKVRPDDPINFLAEFLFKYTPSAFPTPSPSKQIL